MKKTYLTPHTLFGPFAFCGVICQGTFPGSGSEYSGGGGGGGGGPEPEPYAPVGD